MKEGPRPQVHIDCMAPEVLICPDKKRPEENKDKTLLVYIPYVDVWAVGILAFELLTGSPPFEKESRSETYESILYEEPPRLPLTVSSEAKSFIHAALAKDPSHRPSAVDLLKHPWIQQYARSKDSNDCKRRSMDPTSRCSAQSDGFNFLLMDSHSQASALSQPMHRLSRLGIQPSDSMPLPYILTPKTSNAGNNSNAWISSNLHKGGGSQVPLPTVQHHLLHSLDIKPRSKELVNVGFRSQSTSFPGVETRLVHEKKIKPAKPSHSHVHSNLLSTMPASGVLSDDSFSGQLQLSRPFSPGPSCRSFHSASNLALVPHSISRSDSGHVAHKTKPLCNTPTTGLSKRETCSGQELPYLFFDQSLVSTTDIDLFDSQF